MREGDFKGTRLFDLELRTFGKSIRVVAAFALCVAHDAFAFVIGKGKHSLSVVVLCKLARDVFIVCPIDEAVVGSLVLGDAHFRANVAHHFKVVAVEMIGGDVEQHGNVGTEVVHIVELERGDFQYIPISIAFLFDFCHLECERASDVACQSYVETC